MAGIEPTPARSGRAGYTRLSLSASGEEKELNNARSKQTMRTIEKKSSKK
jgi:hypothetical protein